MDGHLGTGGVQTGEKLIQVECVIQVDGAAVEIAEVLGVTGMDQGNYDSGAGVHGISNAAQDLHLDIS